MSAAARATVNILNVIRHPIGGIRSYLRYTYSRLDPGRFRVTVVSVGRPEVRLLPAGMAPLEVELEEVSEDRALLKLVRKTRDLIRERSFHLIHTQGFTAGVVGVLSGSAGGPPHVLTLHETLHPGLFRPPFGGVKRVLLAHVLSRIDRVIVVSRDAFDNLAEFIPIPKAALPKIEIIRNGVAVSALVSDAETAKTDLRASVDPAGRSVLLGYMGRFMPEKGFDVLIEAVHLLSRESPPLRPFKVIAINDGAFIREYQEKIRDRILEAYFLFPGFQASVAGFFPELDAVVMPSFREACPLVAMEAMVMGCPLIASDCVGLREVTRGTPAIVAATGDPASLARAMKQVIDSPAEWKSRAAGYISTARREFDSSRTAERLAAVFERTMAERRSA